MRIRKDSLIPEKIKKEMNAAAKMKLFEVIKCPKPVHKFDFSGLQPSENLMVHADQMIPSMLPPKSVTPVENTSGLNIYSPDQHLMSLNTSASGGVDSDIKRAQ